MPDLVLAEGFRAMHVAARERRTTPQPVRSSAPKRLHLCKGPRRRGMTMLESGIDTRSETYRANAAWMGELVSDLRRVVADIRKGGGEDARRKHLARGKLLPR